MPTYTIKYSNFQLSQKQKNLIAKNITEIHSKVTGANAFFAQIIFEKNKKDSHFMGGKFVKDKEIFLNGQIRAGRTSKVKYKLITKFREILVKNTKLKRDSIWIYLEELIPEQMVEYGEILPKSGKEKKWFKSLPKELKRKLLKLDKKQ